MSLASSDDMFGDAGELSEIPAEEGDLMTSEPGPSAPAAPQYRKQGFSIYTMLLVLSFVFLLTATILFFVDAGKY